MISNAELNKRIAEALMMDLGARTEEDTTEACLKWWFEYMTWDRIKKLADDMNYEDKCRYLPLQYVWICREGQPWQESIEAFHSAWRREPPDWAGDLMTAFEMLPLMEERKLGDEYSRELRWRCQNNKRYPFANGIYAAVAHASARQRSEAALLALGGSLDE